MSDEDIDQLEGRKAAEAKHRAEVEKMRQRWAEEGYDPRQHLQVVVFAGDQAVLQGFYAAERDALSRRRDLGMWLAIFDMHDVSDAARRQRNAEYLAAQGGASNAV